MATLDFSAQFGGRDAAQSAIKTFHRLKAVSKGVKLQGLSVGNLTFILRVDGEVNEYGLSGLGNVDVNIKDDYVSIDIGIQAKDKKDVHGFISENILHAVGCLNDSGVATTIGMHSDILQNELKKFVEELL